MSSAYTSGTNVAEEEISMMDDLLNVDSLTADQQDTYINEEAFLDQVDISSSKWEFLLDD